MFARRGLHDDTPVAWALASPALAGLVLFVGVPFALAAGFSLTDAHLGSPLPVRFVGLRQYVRLFEDEAFRRAIANNMMFAAGVIPVQTALALGLALLLDRPLRGMPLFRTLFFMPVVFPMALVSVIWQLLYAPGPNGPVNAMLDAFTLGLWSPRDFLHDPAWAMPAIMAMSIWQGVGFQMVVMLAGLQSIPSALYESGAIDGAGRWSQFRHITLPQLKHTIGFVVLVTAILSFRVYDQVAILTQGGPVDATTTVMFEAVRAVFERQQLARASAMTVVFFLIVLAITWLQRSWTRQEREIG